MPAISKAMAVALVAGASPASAFLSGRNGVVTASPPRSSEGSNPGDMSSAAEQHSGASGFAASAGAAAVVLAGLRATVRPRGQRRAPRAAMQAGGNLPQAVPFLEAPGYRAFSANHPGDAGFDPLNLWKGDDGTMFGAPLSMQDAEIKHGRLAMLAAVHWPLAEIYHPQIAAALGLKNELTANGLNPSLLNGGLNADPRFAWFLGLVALGAGLTDMGKAKGAGPGDYGFDPLGLKEFRPPVISGSVDKDRNWMAESEIKHGRLAMLAITAFAAQEFVTKVPLAQETPTLFAM